MGVTGSRRARSLAEGSAQHVDVGYSVRFSSNFAKDLPTQEEASGYVDTLKDKPNEFLDNYNSVVEEKALGPALKIESATVTQSAKAVQSAGEAAEAACAASAKVNNNAPSPSASDAALNASSSSSSSSTPTNDMDLPPWAWISIGVAGGLILGALLGGFIASRVISKKKVTSSSLDGDVDKSRMTFGIPGNEDDQRGSMVENPLKKKGTEANSSVPALQTSPEHMPGHEAKKTTKGNIPE